MLSITECRRLLGGADDLTDDQIKTLRDHLYELAMLTVTWFGTDEGSEEECCR